MVFGVFGDRLGLCSPFLGQMPHLSDTRISIIVGVVDDGHGLQPGLVVGFKVKPDTAIRQRAEPVVEERINWAREKNAIKAHSVAYLFPVGIQFDMNVGVVKDAFDHRRKAFGRHELKTVAKIAGVCADMHRHPSGYGSRQRFQEAFPTV